MYGVLFKRSNEQKDDCIGDSGEWGEKGNELPFVKPKSLLRKFSSEKFL